MVGFVIIILNIFILAKFILLMVNSLTMVGFAINYLLISKFSHINFIRVTLANFIYSRLV